MYGFAFYVLHSLEAVWWRTNFDFRKVMRISDINEIKMKYTYMSECRWHESGDIRAFLFRTFIPYNRRVIASRRVE